MSHRVSRNWILCSALLLFSLMPVFGQNDWPNYGPDPGHTRYSILKQITPENVGKLKVAWTYRTGEKFKGPDANLAPQWKSLPSWRAE